MKSITSLISVLTMIASLATASATASTASAGFYKIDPAHTTIQFTVGHLGISHLMGRFNTFEGDVKLQPNGKSKVEFTIQTSSIDTNHTKRDKHLKSPDFFNAKQYPVISFVSDQVKYNNQAEPIKILGQLTMHGKSQPIALDVIPVGAGNDPWGGYRAGYDASTQIKRSDFGMNFMQGGIGDNIHIRLHIEAIKQ